MRWPNRSASDFERARSTAAQIQIAKVSVVVGLQSQHVRERRRFQARLRFQGSSCSCEQGIGLIATAKFRSGLRQVRERHCKVWMIGSDAAFPNSCGLLQERLGLTGLSLIEERLTKSEEGCCDVGMFRPKLCSPDSDSPVMQTASFSVVTQHGMQDGQIVNGGCHVQVVGAKPILPDFKRPLEQHPRRREITVTIFGNRQVVEVCSEQRVCRREACFRDCEGAGPEGFCL